MATDPAAAARRRAQRRLAKELAEVRTGKHKYQVSEAGRAYQNARARQHAKGGMYVLAQEGQRVELKIVRSPTKDKRYQISKHWSLVAQLIQGDSYTRSDEAGRRLLKWEGRMTGGIPSVEFANDPIAIIVYYQTNSEDFRFESIYAESA